jgi:AcrR family transcriptional regulator
MVKTAVVKRAKSVSTASRRRRTRERVETRQKILHAAREMFVRHGYEATTMRAIAERIEYTPTAIYHHFRNKEELLTELCSADLRALAAAFQRVGQISDPVERLRRTGETYVDFALEHPMQYQLLFMTRRPTVRDKSITRGDPAQDAYAFLGEVCSAVIATGRVRPEFTDAEQLAQMAWAGLHGLLALHIVRRDDAWIDWRDVRATASRICDSLLVGILQRPSQ